MTNKKMLSFVEKAYNEGNLPECDYKNYKEEFKEISAKEMFKKLGYEQFNYSNGIRYTDGNTEQNIEFENGGFINIYNTCYNREQDVEVLTVEEIQAIYQQIKDLGWDWNEQ